MEDTPSLSATCGSTARVIAVLLLYAAALPGQSAPPTISVDVTRVVLNTTVLDHHGAFVSGLDKQNFQVFEDGAPQPILSLEHEDVPVAVGLVVDGSGSMGPKRKDVAAAALAFIRASNPRDQMFVIHFNEHVAFALPPAQPFSASAAELEAALGRNPVTGRTALYDAILAGLGHVAESPLEKKVLIVISDGGDNASRHTLRQVLDAAARSNALIFTIGLFDENDEDRNPGALRKIARASGGEAFIPPTPASIVPVCERIAEDIRRQYTIAYAPPGGTLDNRYHRIRVTATGPRGSRLEVRVREGYLASGGDRDNGSHGAGAAGRVEQP